mgnify:FL=1
MSSQIPADEEHPHKRRRRHRKAHTEDDAAADDLAAAEVATGAGTDAACGQKDDDAAVTPPPPPSAIECLLCASEVCTAMGVMECGHSMCHVCALKCRRQAMRHDSSLAAGSSSGVTPAAACDPQSICCPVCRGIGRRLFIVIEPPPYDAAVLASRVACAVPNLLCEIVAPPSAPKGQPSLHEEYGFVATVDEVRSQLQVLDGLLCPFAECWDATGQQIPFSHMMHLHRHLRDAHRVQYCECCLEHKPVFLSQQHVYNDNEIQRHVKGACAQKDSEAFTGHPRCLFCRKNMYDADHLLKHMQHEHMTCDLCNTGEFKFTYYRDRAALLRHFDARHCVCRHRDCAELDVFLRVFHGDLELQSHLCRMHGVQNRGVSLDNFGFKFGGGTAFDPPVGSSRSGVNGRSGGAAAAPPSSGLHASSVPSTGANTQATKIFFDHVSHLEEVGLVPLRPDGDFLREQDRVQVGTRQDQQENESELSRHLDAILTQDQVKQFKRAAADYLSGSLLATEYYSKFRAFFKHPEDHDYVFDRIVKSFPHAIRRDALVKAKIMMTCEEEEKRRKAAEDDKVKRGHDKVRSLHRAITEKAERGGKKRATTTNDTPQQLSWAAAAAPPAMSSRAAPATLSSIVAQHTTATGTASTSSSYRGTTGHSASSNTWASRSNPSPPPPPPPPASIAPSQLPSTAMPPVFTDPTAFPGLPSTSNRRGKPQANPSMAAAWNVHRRK